jgi:hypothetical protein
MKDATAVVCQDQVVQAVSFFLSDNVFYFSVCSFSFISNQDPLTRKVVHLLVQMVRHLVDLLLIDLHRHRTIWEDLWPVVLQWAAHPNVVHLPWVDLLTGWEDPHKT